MNEKECKLTTATDVPIMISDKNQLAYYDENISKDDYKKRYAGTYAKDSGKRLSKASLKRIWNKFVREERIDFFKAHNTFQIEDIVMIGIDKFINTMGWTKPQHVKSWHNNRIRVGICCHCRDQFIPMIFQANHGLCNNCRPLYSVPAMQNFVKRELANSERYYKARRDMLMDFYIMFYHDSDFRKLFLKDSEMAKELENLEVEMPEWLVKDEQLEDDFIEGEFKEVEPS